MTDTSLERKDLPLMIGPLGTPMRRGIICPYNRDEFGPAKRKLQCGIWKDWDTYDYWGEDATHFCKSICEYGKRYAAQRSAVERAHNSWAVQRMQRESFLRRVWAPARKWWQRPIGR